MLTQEEILRFDEADSLRDFRKEFYIPQTSEGKDIIYFCGNSLGLQPRRTEEYLKRELTLWRERGVEGHFTGEKPWVDYHTFSKEALMEIMGANRDEVLAMGSLTTNLHLLMASFYRPVGQRRKVIIERGAFPSDFYAVHSHMQMKGVDPEEHLIELYPMDGGHYISNDYILEIIAEIGDELALVMLPGVQYYTGQFFDIPRITRTAHDVGAYCGFDLAHAAGNVPLNLHEDNVDFAAWCSYKYLNSGPGGEAGIFVHGRHALDASFPRLSGWWGHDARARFEMSNTLNPIPSVDGWQLSNVNILSSAAHLASLSIFREAGFPNLRKKSVQLTGVLEKLIMEDELLSDKVRIITPENPEERGCQLSLFFEAHGRAVFDEMTAAGVIFDWREPNVIRVAPTPLYNTFREVYEFVQIMKRALSKQFVNNEA